MVRGRGGRSTLAILVCIAIAMAAGVVAGHQGQIPKEPVKWSMKAGLPQKPVRPGQAFSLHVTATIEEGWHLYSTEQIEGGPIPTRIFMPPDQPFAQAGTIESSEPKTAMDPSFNLMTEFYEEEAAFTIPVKAGVNAAAGKSEVKVNVSFQTCNDQICLPPKTVKLAVTVNVTR